MRWLKWTCVALALAFVASMIVFRMLPLSLEGVHVRYDPSGLGQMSQPQGHVWREPQVGDGRAQMAAFDAVIRATPRTKQVAGSYEEGVITYITRSRVFGFPDITSVWRDVALVGTTTPAIEVAGLARYGTLDFGVNRDRIQGWLVQLGR